MTRQASVFRSLQPVLIAACAAIGWLGYSAEAATTENLKSVSFDADTQADFLRPEAIMLRKCSPPSSQEHSQASRADTGASSGHYCVANFIDAEQWKASARGVESQLSYPHDVERNSRVLAVRFKEVDNGIPRIKFRLVSNAVQQTRFEKVESVRLWVKGNGSSAGLRVWLKDRDGEMFTPQKHLWLTFDTWALEDLSFAPGYVLSPGKQANGTPDPPLVLHRIEIVGSPETLHGEIKIDRLSVIGVPWHGETVPSDRPAPRTHINTPGSPAPIELQLIKRSGSHIPMNVGSTVQTKVIVKNNLKSVVHARIETTIHRVLGKTETQETVQQLGPGVRRKVSIPINLAFPGWYRAVVCTQLGEAPPSCVHDEFFAWEAVGNDIEDTPPTFPGAMIPADAFLGGLSADLHIMKQAGVKVLRFPFRWERIETMRGKYNWRPYDTIFELCRRANIIPQPMVVNTPNWARRVPHRVSEEVKSGTANSPPENMETFRSFMEKAAKRYARYSPYWEIWNEPISRAHWAGTYEDYIAFLRAGYNGVKAADSTARVLSAGAWAEDGAPERFSRHLMENGRDYFDILAVHSHGGVHKLNHNLDDFDTLWANVKDRPPIWLNETGVTVDPRRKDGELVKAAETVKKMVVARARGVDNFGWFLFKNLPNSYRSPYNNFSAMDQSGGPRPVLLAYNNAIRWLRKTRLNRAETGTHGYAMYEFRGGGRRVMVAWGRDPEVVTPLTRLPAWVTEGVDIYDMFGGPAANEIEKNPLTIELSGNPVFLIARDTVQ